MPMVFLIPGEIRLIARPGRQRKSWSDFEFVLEVKELFPGDGVAARLPEYNAHRVEHPEHIIRHRIPRGDAAKSRAARIRERAVQSEVHLVSLPAAFQRVAAVDPRQRIAKMPV